MPQEPRTRRTTEIRTAVHDLYDALRPGKVRTDAAVVDERWRAGLAFDELQLVATASTSRQAEFATGRWLLHRLTGDPTPILTTRGRAPVLPPGWTGSLTHDLGIVVAAVSRHREIAGLGVDLGRRDVLTDPTEAAIVLAPGDVIDDAALAFVVKEAVFKAWSAATASTRLLEHHDVVIRTIDAAAFTAAVLDRWVVDGRYGAVGDDAWLAVAAVGAAAVDTAAASPPSSASR